MLIDLKIIGGFLGFGALALAGLALLSRGVRGDIYDWLGEARASRWWFVTVGLLLQPPLVVWVVFVVRQGWFTRWS
jgi:hypothetical protein